ncbi:MAG: iron-containing alcohol dehydrogenase, partial [Longimicrobiales bacterium]
TKTKDMTSLEGMSIASLEAGMAFSNAILGAVHALSHPLGGLYDLPRVRFTKTEVKAHGDGVFTVEAEVENAGFLPTSLRHGQTSRSVGPTFLQIQIDDDDILTGADKTARIGVLAGSGSRESVTWVIRGQEGSRVEIRLHSEKSGRDTTTVTLR